MSAAVADREQRTLRRALLAAAIAGGVIAVGGLVAVAAAGAGGSAGLAVVVLGLAVGSLVGSGWLLLAAALDTYAGEPISARRWRWTIALCIAAAVLTVAAPAALGAPPS